MHSSVEETQSLLPQSVQQIQCIHTFQQPLAMISLFLQRYFVKSKASVLILMWTVLIGAIYQATFGIILMFLVRAAPLVQTNIGLPFVILYSFLVFVFIFYPINGFIADVYCGRFRIIITSMCVILLSLTSFLLIFVVFFYAGVPNNLRPFLFLVLGLALFLTVFGIGGFNANIIQFGLDQLVDAPSRRQAYFVHWSKWCYDSSSVVVVGLFAYYSCPVNDLIPGFQLFVLPNAVCIALLFLLTIISLWKRRWFLTEPGQNNPYGMVARVLNFCRRHKHPLQRSAFTYCDDERPSRLDFAKERFGGPFTTEQVEDVKTLFRLLILLLAVGPVFVMDVPSSYVAVLKLGVHIGSYQSRSSCSWDWIIVNSGLLRCFVCTAFLPIYIIFLQKYNPRIFVRTGVGIVIYSMGIVAMLAADITGHLHGDKNDPRCIFNAQLINDTVVYFPHLDMHWSFLIAPNILLGIGPSLVTVSIIEFISAQSPHSMKGLLLGAFFSITGVFQFIGSVLIVPFASYTKDKYYPGFSCLLDYLILIFVIAIIGLILFCVVALKYKYRERDDRPYDQRFVVDVYDRYLNEVSQ